jgi:hypothetical protein
MVLAHGQPLDVLGEDVDLEVHGIAGMEVGEGRLAKRVRNEGDLDPVVVDRRDRERDAVDRERALLDAVAGSSVGTSSAILRPSPSGSTLRTRPTPSTWPWT